MIRRYLAAGALALLVTAAGCAGRAPGSGPAIVPDTRAVKAAAGKELLAYGGSGSGSFSWNGNSGQKCSGTVTYSANVEIKFASDGKVETNGGSVVANGTLKPACSAFGSSVSISFKPVGGSLTGKSFSVKVAIANGFCTPGTASGTATLSGDLADSDVHMTKVVEKCKYGTEKMDAGAAQIHGLKGELIGR